MAAGAAPLLAAGRCLALLTLAVLSCLLQAAVSPAAASQPSSVSKPLRPLEASTAAEGGAAALRRTCWYTVKVKTSCSSPRRWSNAAVSLAFGDAYRDEVYVARLAPRDGGFERCATDTFRVSGPCGYGVCYLYLRRATGGGYWAPEWVRVYEPTSSTPSTFYYGGELPTGVWYGFNRCLSRTDAPRLSDDAAVQYM